VGRVTLQTIADSVGVSRMTVSNAFSKPDQLSDSLRNRILSVADKLGYVGPDPTARALASGTTGAIGLLLAETNALTLTDEIAMSFISGVADELQPSGLALSLLSAQPRDDDGIVPARDVAMDGVLVYSCDPTSPAVGWITRRRLPMVFIDREPASGITSINIDDRGGAQQAAQHIVDLGHTRVGIITHGYGGSFGVLDDPHRAGMGYIEYQRMLGWLGPLEKAGITPRVIRDMHGDPQDVGYAAAQSLLSARERPTAILCFSDALARGVIRAAQDAGLDVPEDLSVVGFDDNPVGRRTRPALTTVRQDADAKGRAAVTALTAAIERAKAGKPAPRARHIKLATEFIVRESTAKPPRTGR
jgi:DNA-binding LacI/PurR family transcriptional regulator